MTARVVSLRLFGMPDRILQEAKRPARPNGISIGQNVIRIHAEGKSGGRGKDYASNFPVFNKTVAEEKEQAKSRSVW